jgi:phosphoserine phosphatase RsbU/P
VKAALVAISVHNILRSSSLSTKTLLEPDQVLATLNGQFAMDRHDGNYFTIWYGVYQPSTGTLRYAGAGHPPALLFTAGDGGSASQPLATSGHVRRH